MIANLYRVLCRGMQSSHGCRYVVAQDPTQAYAIVRKDLDDRSLGFNDERALLSVELIAEDAPYPACGVRLHRGERWEQGEQ